LETTTGTPNSRRLAASYGSDMCSTALTGDRASSTPSQSVGHQTRACTRYATLGAVLPAVFQTNLSFVPTTCRISFNDRFAGGRTHEYRTTRVAVGRSQTRSRGRVLGRRLQDVLGELVQTTAGTWITKPPSRCPNGHRLGPGEVLVGHQACLGHGGGHTTWTCSKCDQTVYGPLNTHCSALDGPATVRISTQRS
jgi:hypothetical protein